MDLYGEFNKVSKTSFVQFQIKWHKYCSAFLLRDALSLLDIEIEENNSANNTPLPESNCVMISNLSVVYSALLEHALNYHCTSSIETESPFETVILMMTMSITGLEGQHYVRCSSKCIKS